MSLFCPFKMTDSASVMSNRNCVEERCAIWVPEKIEKKFVDYPTYCTESGHREATIVTHGHCSFLKELVTEEIPCEPKVNP